MNKIKIIFITIVCLAILSSCSSVTRSSLADVPSEVNQTLDDNLVVNAKVNFPIDIKNDIYKYKARFFIANSEKIYDELFINKNVTTKRENPSEDETNSTNHYYLSDDGCSLICGGASVTFSTPFSTKIFTSFHERYSYGFLASDGLYNADLFLEKKDFSFLTAEDAADKVKTILTDWDIGLYSEIDTYYIDYKNSNEQYTKLSDSLTNKNNYSWSEDDNCYYFRLYQSVDNIPVANIVHGNIDDGSAISENNIQVVYSKDGIQYLNCEFLYSIDEKSKEKVELISLDEALETVKNKYNNIIIFSEIDITNIDFSYVSVRNSKNDNDFKLVPAWVFELHQNDEEQDNCEYIIVNAETGEEIV